MLFVCPSVAVDVRVGGVRVRDVRVRDVRVTGVRVGEKKLKWNVSILSIIEAECHCFEYYRSGLSVF